MSVDLNFWKYEKDTYLDNAAIYQKACCDNENVAGLAVLPIDNILKEIAAAFDGWNAIDLYHYEKVGEQGSFEITTTPQIVRFDCYSMELADMKRFSEVMARFGCPLYDPQQGVRFDKVVAFLIGEASEYKAEVENQFSRLLPHFEVLTQMVSWEEYTQLSKECKHIYYDMIIHRAKTLTKVVSTMQFGRAWASRTCQCKTAQLEDKDKEHQILGELLQKSIERVVNDFRERTYYGNFSDVL